MRDRHAICGAWEAPPAGFWVFGRKGIVRGAETPCAGFLGDLHKTAEKCHGAEG